MAYQAILQKSNVGVGRVQTPVLAMVENRRLAIANFKSTDYFIPVITLRDGTVMRWHKRGEAAAISAWRGADAERARGLPAP